MDLIKNCPICGKEQKYSRIDLLRNALKNNTPCNSCKQIGEKNHFYGKKHTDESKKSISQWNKCRGKEINKKISDKLKNIPKSDDHKKKISDTLKGKFIGELNPNFGKKLSDEQKRKISKKIIEYYYKSCKYENYLNSLPEYKRYRKEVWKITKKNNLNDIEFHEKRGSHKFNKDAFHLDHIFPISQGFFYKISPELIGDIKNLKFIPWRENISKNGHIKIIPIHIKEEYEKRKKSN